MCTQAAFEHMSTQTLIHTAHTEAMGVFIANLSHALIYSIPFRFVSLRYATLRIEGVDQLRSAQLLSVQCATHNYRNDISCHMEGENIIYGQIHRCILLKYMHALMHSMILSLL